MNRGGQASNNNAGRGREAARALEIALDELGGNKTKPLIGRMRTLVDLWKVQIERANEDTPSFAMIVDRLDGKPRQSQDINLSRSYDDMNEEEIDQRLKELERQLETSTED